MRARRGAGVVARGALLLALALLCGLALAPRGLAQQGPVVLGAGCTVSDLPRAIEFYTQVLDFRLLGVEEQAGESLERLSGVFAARTLTARLALGEESFELTQFLAPEGRPIPIDSRSQDRWFQHVAIVVADMPRAYARLREHGVRHASSGPQRLPDSNPAAGGIEAFYFKDPDGHVLELIAFPPGKGEPRWQDPSARGEALFLGIDHTAIVVADSAASLAFWRDALGLHVAGTSENFGPEQERLNGVFGAHLLITGLRGAAGPGVEFLQYLSPSDGRPYPADARAPDLLHWETRVQVDALDELALALRARRAGLVSTDVAETPEGRRALVVRDPDGHAVRLVERAAAPSDN